MAWEVIRPKDKNWAATCPDHFSLLFSTTAEKLLFADREVRTPFSPKV